MRELAIMIAVCLAGCGDSKKPDTHDAAVKMDGATPDAPWSCAPSGTCANGPMCGTTCCGTGEHCVNGTCMCGSMSSCTDGNSCMIGGPIAPGPCGSVCCGGTIGCPIGRTK